MSDSRERALELALEHNRTLSHVGQADLEAKKVVSDAGLFLAFLSSDGVPDGVSWVHVDAVNVGTPTDAELAARIAARAKRYPGSAV